MKEMTERAIRFPRFIKQHKGLTIYTIILALICYGLSLGKITFGMDTNQYLSVPQDYLKHWISIGRFGQVLLKKLEGSNVANLYLANLLGILLLISSSLLLCTLFAKCLKDQVSTLQLAVIPSLFVTSPFFMTQFYFVLQIFEFMLGLFLTILAAYLLAGTTMKFPSWWQMITATLCLSFACSIYLSFLLLFTALTASILLLQLLQFSKQQQNLALMDLIKQAVPYLLVFGFGVGLYFVGDTLVLQITKIANVDHSSNDRLWGQVPFTEALDSLIKSIGKITIAPSFWKINPVYGPQFLIGGLLSLLPLVKIKTVSFQSRLSYLICLMVLLISAVGTVIAAGTLLPPRSMAPQFPFVIALCFFLASLSVTTSKLKKGLLLLVGYFTLSQLAFTTKLLVSQQATYKEDQDRVQQLLTLAQPLVNQQHKRLSQYRLAIIGAGPARNRFVTTVPGEMIGVSLFDFGYPDASGPSRNVADLLIINGQAVQYPIPSSYNQLREKYESQTRGDGSLRVVIDSGYLVVIL